MLFELYNTMVFLQILCRTTTISAAQGSVCWHYTVSKRSGVKWPWQRDPGSRVTTYQGILKHSHTHTANKEVTHMHKACGEYTIHQQFSIISNGSLQLFPLLAGCEYPKVERKCKCFRSVCHSWVLELYVTEDITWYHQTI